MSSTRLSLIIYLFIFLIINVEGKSIQKRDLNVIALPMGGGHMHGKPPMELIRIEKKLEHFIERQNKENFEVMVYLQIIIDMLQRKNSKKTTPRNIYGTSPIYGPSKTTPRNIYETSPRYDSFKATSPNFDYFDFMTTSSY
uniref:Uncharacterized protein n=1 Tax=Parastrongyloides trichosuri TaxID=131310 RepID=A0A0N4Z687_PARTI